jgi:hypothetical protein
MELKFFTLMAALKVNPGEVGIPNSTNSVSDALNKTVSALIYLIGGLSVIFIIVGGLQLALSAGSPTRVKQGRETILYACVGLGVAIAAQAIVLFVAKSV